MASAIRASALSFSGRDDPAVLIFEMGRMMVLKLLLAAGRRLTARSIRIFFGFSRLRPASAGAPARCTAALALSTAAAMLCLSSATAQAACQTSVDFTGKTVGQSVTLDVSSCSEPIRAGLYTTLGFDSQTGYPMVGNPGGGTPASINGGNGVVFLVTPGSTDGSVYFDYTIQLTTMGSSNSASIPLFYASQSCPLSAPCAYSLANGGNVYAITDTSYPIAVTNLPLPPTVTSLNPTSGPAAGTNSVVITGTGFTGTTGAASVKFGATNATSYVVNSATQITAVAPAGTGTVNVTVTNNAVTSATGAGTQYTYLPAPTVTALNPTSGPAGGTNSVVITGTGFTGTSGAAGVRFGATNATSYVVDSATQITAVAPAGTGVVNVTVTNNSATSATGAGNQYTYIAGPAVTALNPTSGTVAGGNSVVITGTGFTGTTGAASVRFGATNATSYVVNSATQITAVAPSGTGVVNVTVTNNSATSATGAGNQYTYVAAPTVTAVSPTAGPTSGGTSVVITGTNLSGATAVNFGATAAAGFTVNSATQITATSPAGTGTVDITVTTVGGTSAISAADQFTYVAAPTVTSIAPTSGPAAGGTSVTITGTNLSGVNAVVFGATPATGFTVDSATQITATSPAGTGTVDVRVTTVGGTSATSAADQFTYVAAPTVTSIAPTSGPTAGGTSVVMACAAVVAVIEVALATVNVVTAVPPMVTAVAPVKLLPVIVTFTGATSVTFGGTAATSFTVGSATSITATTPAHAAGAVDITVTTPGGTATGAGLYSYIVPVTTTSLASSRNPSEAGQAVTFTATVSANGAMPTGTVTFSDGGVAIGSASLTGGVAAFTTSALAIGNHTITAAYAGNANFAASTSAPLLQAVNTPQDSLKLRALQIVATRTVAQNSGSAISGAIDSAIGEGFSNGAGPMTTPGAGGVRFNFSADPDQETTTTAERTVSQRWNGDYGTAAYATRGRGGVSRGEGNRVDDAFAAIDRSFVKARAPRPPVEPKDWLLWGDIRGSGISNWHSSGPSVLYGTQVNGLLGLTHRLTPNFLVGVVGGYEVFDYRSDTLNGRLKGDGWTVGSYLGWKFAAGLRFDAAVAYTGLGYDGTAGTATGKFNGDRWLVSGGLTGSTEAYGFAIEPSARVYALWEQQNAYTDSLGTPQAERSFFTGRASTGFAVAYPWLFDAALTISPYAGIYADYYFTGDDAASVTLAGGGALTSTPFIDGWSARATGGLAARFGNGAAVAFGAELGGIGNNVQIWSFRGRGSVPF
ncbi:phospholipase [Tardiphaga sp. vice304]|nr:phospholipase [Tardiphaga sp. vice304]